MALAIAGLFVGGPLGVGAVGYFLGRWLGHPALGALVGGLAGFAAATFEAVRMVRSLPSNSSKRNQ
jgi:F0F1-type ATP synthase assembly protein I